MLARLFLAAIVVLFAVAEVFGQLRPASSAGTTAPAWRPANDATERAAPGKAVGTAAGTAPLATIATPGTATGPTASSPASSPAKAAPAADVPRQPIAKVTNGNGTLPNEKGQIWREYDISPYTARVTTTERPEQAIVDCILRETGYEAWHAEPLGILSATKRTLRVYHTPEMQGVVADLVDRFVSSEAETSTFGMRVITLDQPNWRAKVQRLLRPVAVQTPGASAWLLEKEDALALLAELQRRSDFREHSSPHLLVNNGQATVVSALRPRPYIRDLTLRADVPAGYEPVPGQIDEGFLLDFNPLLSIDRKMIDAAIKCDVTQVEKVVPVVLEVATPTAPRQRAKIEVPQTTHLRFHERFRWPVDKVLLVSMGMVAMPVPVDGKAAVPGIPLLGTSPARAELLVLVECKGQTREAPRVTRTPEREAKRYRERY